MKLTLSFYLLLGVLSAPAQSSVGSPSTEPLVVTNRDVFRETMSAPRKAEHNPRWQEVRGELLESRTNVLVVRIFELKNIYGPVPPPSLPPIGNGSSHLYDPPPMRPVVGQKKEYRAVVALRNCPVAAGVTNGQEIVFRAMVTGTYGWGGSLVELYECAQPARNPHP